MANLVELSKMAEDMPDEQLIQATQGQGNFPPFVAITEIKRRTDLRKAYEAQQPKPQASVAEEVVAEFANSPSGLGAMAQSSDLQQAFPSGDMSNMAPPSPMQMMASGGRTGYKVGSDTKYPLLEAKSKVSAEQHKKILNQIAEARLEKFGIAGKMANLGDRAFSIMGGSGNNIRLNPTEEKLYIQLANEMIDKKASGGRTGYKVGGMSEQEMLKNQFLQSQGFASTLPAAMQEQQQLSKENLKKIGVLNQDGSINKGNLAKAIGSGLLTAAAVAAVLAPEPTTTALGAARLGLTGLPSKIGSAITSGYQSGLRKIGERKMGKVASAPIVSKMNPKTLEGIGDKAIKDLKLPTRILGGLGGGAGLFGLSRIFGGSDEVNPLDVKTQNDDSKDKIGDDLATGDVNADKGLGQRFKDFATSPNNADLLIGLGGAIGSARNLGELSSSISDAYFGVKSSRDAAEFKGLQGRLLEAQIADMEPKSIINEQNSIIAFLKQAQEGAITLTDEQKKQLNDRYFELQEQLDLMRSKTGTGFAASEAPTGGDIQNRLNERLVS